MSTTPVAPKLGRTKIEVHTLNYIWTIQNFSFHDSVLKSPEFGDHENYMWRMYLSRNEYCFSLKLKSVSCYEVRTKAKCKFSILNCKGEEMNLREIQEPRYIRSNEYIGFDNFIAKDSLFNKDTYLLIEDKLTLTCELSYAFDISNFSDNSVDMQFKEPECKLVEHFGSLIANEKLSDVKLVVGDREIPAHKAILAVRSNVFGAMFEHDMNENKLNRVIIDDISPEVLKGVMHFIYTGKVPNLERIADDLLIAADKYALEKLKVMCEKVICEYLSVETAVTTLILADLHSAYQLKEETLNFIKLNATKVMATQEWQNMLTTHSYLIGDAFAVLATQ